MRLLMVQVPTSHLGAGERVYPLGLARLAGLVPDSVSVRGLDMNLSPDPWPVLKEVLEDFQPRMVMFSFRNMDPLAGHHASYLSALRTAVLLVRRVLPKAVLVAGGPAFSLFPERLMAELQGLDYGVSGEGESVLPHLLSENCEQASVPGLMWRNKDRLVSNPAPAPFDLERLPEPDKDLFPPGNYRVGNRYVAAMGIEGKRGCNHRCSYCVYPVLANGKMRLRDPKRIVDEMASLQATHNIDLFHFTDPVLNSPPEHFRELCEEMIRRRLKVSWTGFFREDTLSRDMVHRAMDAGLNAIYFSGDALTDQGLLTLNKGLRKEDLFRAARITADSNILTMCHFLVNLPFEEEAQVAEARETLDRLLSIHSSAGNLGAVIFNTVRLYPGAPLTKTLMEAKLLDKRRDLLYPTYFDPPAFSNLVHELEAFCHGAGVFSRLGL